MGIIERLYTGMIAFLDGVGETQFGEVAAELASTGQVLASVTVILVLINMSVQRVPAGTGESIALIVKVVLVAIFMQNWADFNSLVNAIYGLFDSLAAVVLSAALGVNEGGFAETLDALLEEQGEIATKAVGRLDILGAVMNGIFWLLMVVFSAITALAMITARVVLTILIGLAPLAIMCLLTEKTKNYFETWFSAMIQFMLYPVIIAGILGTIAAMMQSVLLETPGAEANTIGQTMPIGVVLVMSIMLVLLSPFILQAITGRLDLGGFSSRVSGMGMSGAAGAAGVARGAMGGSGASSAIGRAGEAVGAGGRAMASDTSSFLSNGRGVQNLDASVDERRRQFERSLRIHARLRGK